MPNTIYFDAGYTVDSAQRVWHDTIAPLCAHARQVFIAVIGTLLSQGTVALTLYIVTIYSQVLYVRSKIRSGKFAVKPGRVAETNMPWFIDSPKRATEGDQMGYPLETIVRYMVRV